MTPIHCPFCTQSFASAPAFDLHRIGLGKERRCLLPREMHSQRFQKDPAGCWTREPVSHRAAP